jgi:hypothetical protein
VEAKTLDMDSDFLWHTLGGSAIIAGALTLARLLIDYCVRGGERRVEQAERRRSHQRDAEARLERILQDRLAESDRRLERFDADLREERVRSAALERELVRIQQAYDVMRVEYASLLHARDTPRLPH